MKNESRSGEKSSFHMQFRPWGNAQRGDSYEVTFTLKKKKKSVFRTFVLGEAEGALFIAHLYTLLLQDTVQA